MIKEVSVSASLICKVYETNAAKYQFVGECKDLGISVQASDLNELCSVFEEAMASLLTDLIEDGELDEFLKSKGWNKNDIPRIQQQVKQNPVIPWGMIAEFNADARQKAVA